MLKTSAFEWRELVFDVSIKESRRLELNEGMFCCRILLLLLLVLFEQRVSRFFNMLEAVRCIAREVACQVF